MTAADDGPARAGASGRSPGTPTGTAGRPAQTAARRPPRGAVRSGPQAGHRGQKAGHRGQKAGHRGQKAGHRGQKAAGPGGRAGRIVPTLALPLTDAAGLAAAVVITWPGLRGGSGPAGALYAPAVLALLAGGGTHRLRICLRVTDQAGRILGAAALPLAALALLLPARQIGWLALWSAGLVFGCRAAVYTALRAARRRGMLSEPTLVIGAGTFGAYVAGLLSEHRELGLRPVGFLDGGPPRQDLPLPTLGKPVDLPKVIGRLGIRRVIVCYSSSCRDEDLVAVIRSSRHLRADICVVPRLYELAAAVPRASLDEIWGIPLIPLRNVGQSSAGRAVKRAFDVIAVFVLLTLAAPLLLALVAVIRLRSGRAALFRQSRVTGRGRVASILKLRTLAEHADPDSRWAVPEEDCTPLGRWLRASHADELPQLVNVLRGEMSLVGPRPERPFFAECFSREIPRYADRTRMPAGITGWAQVNGLHGDTSIFERARFDNYYVEYWSPWLDVVILARTLAAAARSGRNARR